MKKLLVALLMGSTALVSHAQTVTIDFTVGILANQSGVTLTDGSLIQIIASSDSVFDAPSPTAFVNGNDILVASFAFDSTTTGIPGAMALIAPSILLADYPIALSNLAIRWYPSLTIGATDPGYSTFYGQYGFNQDASWVAPSAGGALSYEMLTVSSGAGSVPDIAGHAALQTAPIPEPSTYAAILGALALGFVAYRRRQQAVA